MAKRLTDTEIWNQDWFIQLGRDHKIFWMFLKDDCDYAGIWRPNFSRFKAIHRLKFDADEALRVFNQDKERILVLQNKRWFLRQFIAFQYGTVLNERNGVHRKVLEHLSINGVDLAFTYPQVSRVGATVVPTVQEQDKEEDKILKKGVVEKNNGTWEPGIGRRGGR